MSAYKYLIRQMTMMITPFAEKEVDLSRFSLVVYNIYKDIDFNEEWRREERKWYYEKVR